MFERVSGLGVGPTTLHEYIVEKQDDIQNLSAYRFTVMGKREFPLDMLRSDRCYPADTVSALNIATPIDLRHELREVTLISDQPRRHWTPTFERWKSFGWFVKWTAGSLKMKPMLASPAKDIKFPLYASPKIDGIRAYVQDGKLLSRSGKLIPNRYVQEILGRPELNGVDGELCVGLPNDPNLMQKTTSGIMTYTSIPNFSYWIFDVWTMANRPYRDRLNMLTNETIYSHYYLKELADKKQIQFLEQKLIASHAELNIYEEKWLSQGYEGVMLRNPNATYKFGRSTAKQGALLKLKRWEDGEAEILDFNEFMHNANQLEQDNFGYAKRSTHQANKVPMNMLGSLVCKDLKTGQPIDIGTGFTHDQRNEIWQTRDLVKGMIAKYKHFANAGVKDAPRFPVFVGFQHPEDM